MGCLKRYTKSVDGTIPVPALLYEEEDLLASQEGVGIYDGAQKSSHHQSGSIHTTTHRLFYIDGPHPRSRSFALDLSHVSRTEHYAGLFTSSPKITLYLHPLPTTANSSSTPDTISVGGETWECEVCGNKNAPGSNPTALTVCTLCGVPRSSTSGITPASSASVPISNPKKLHSTLHTHQISTSLPSSTANLLSSPSPTTASSGSELIRGENGEIPCPACTFLNHRSLPACEICGTALPKPKSTPGTSWPPKSAPSSRPSSPMLDDDDDDEALLDPSARMIRLSFRKGGDKAFYAVMRRSLLGKGWEAKRIGQAATSNPMSSGANIGGFSGIHSILQNVESSTVNTQTGMEDALHDLESLMVKAKDMVKLAQDLNERLTAATAAAAQNTVAVEAQGTPAVVEPEEATFIRSSLSQLGLQMTNAPVTLDMIRDERKWIEELARELASVLQGTGAITTKSAWDFKGEEGGGMMRKRGVVALDEIWGGWNRARGVALIPPSTFLQTIPLLPMYTSPPIHMRTFASSGLSVLHTPPFTQAAFASRVVGMLTLSGPRTTVEVAHEEQLPVGLAQEMVYEAEGVGEICRDECGSGVGVFGSQGEIKWWPNVFRGYVWDGHEF